MTMSMKVIRVGRLASAAGILVAGLAAWAGAPVGRYTVDAAAGIVTDNATGLVWQRCVLGVSGANCDAGAARFASQADAASGCSSLNLGGWPTGWRLPTVKELQSIVDMRAVAPAIDSTAFPGGSTYYFWTSTPYAGDATRAWTVHFSGGFTPTYATTSTLEARCVR
jgi:uncharacterized protein DUF1566